jgi:hypothetical protein
LLVKLRFHRCISCSQGTLIALRGPSGNSTSRKRTPVW